MTDAKLQSQIEEFVIHLEEVETAFNAQSDACGLGVHLDVSDLIDQTRRGRNYRKILGFFGKGFIITWLVDRPQNFSFMRQRSGV